MSYFDDASLVMIPSGYKTSKVYSVKPTDGSGDLTFSRSNDTATRVNSAGLIEKVRTNLILQSAGFSTASWDKVTTTVSANTTANPLDGTVNADTITLGAGTTQKFVAQVISLNGNYTVSVYLKAGTHQYAQILLGTDSNAYANFDLSNGTLGTTLGVTARIVSAGNGWYRCSMAFSTTTADSVFILAIDSPSAFRYSTTSSTGTMIAFGYQVETGDIATDYIATTSAAVSVGPVANVPRLDYLNSSCPRLLLEPQRTNVMLYSEQLNNAAWDNPNQVTITANAGISPDGYANADRVLSTGSTWFLAQQKTLTNGTTYVLSMYVKSNTSSNQTFRLVANGNVVSSNFTATTSWQRFTLQFTGDTGLLSHGIVRDSNNSSADLLVWGAQLEAGAYATSYIPTLGAAVTRGQESSSKTSASALIGQTEGTLYSEFVVNGFADFGTPLCINDGGTGESIWLTTFANGDIRAEVYSNAGGGVQASFTKSGNVVGQTYKIAIGYAVNNFSFFVNGVQVGATDLLGTIPVGMNRVDFDYTIPSSFVQSALAIKQALVFKTRLSNADLAALTTI